MKPRITINTTPSGEIEIWLNEQGRDLLVRELQALDEKNDHFHLSPLEFVETSTRPYRRSTPELTTRLTRSLRRWFHGQCAATPNAC